jgi:hypothetical protein
MKNKELALHIHDLTRELNGYLHFALAYALKGKKDGVDWNNEALEVFDVIRRAAARAKQKAIPRKT